MILLKHLIRILDYLYFTVYNTVVVSSDFYAMLAAAVYFYLGEASI